MNAAKSLARNGLAEGTCATRYLSQKEHYCTTEKRHPRIKAGECRLKKEVKMKYILNEPYTLRGWRGIPHTLCKFGTTSPIMLNRDDFMFLLTCNGEVEVSSEENAQEYIENGVIREAKEGETIKIWQKYKHYDNKYFNAVSFAPTLRCNYKCRHCFNAKDESKPTAELTFDECMQIYDEMQECGIGTIRYTGGEPFMHPQFLELVLNAHRRGIFVNEILSNGALITREALEAIRNEPPAETEFGRQTSLFPLIMISFDGVGKHDWLRDTPGAEEKAIAAIKLAKEYGFNVSVHVCIHKGNVDNLIETARFLDSLGVNVMRVIRVSEAPRWVQTSSEYNLPPEEYFEKMVDFFKEYHDEGLRPMLELWGVFRYFPMYDGRLDWMPQETDMETLMKMPVCGSTRDHLHIAADKMVFPCNIMSGVMRALGEDTPKVIEMPLKDIIENSTCMNLTCSTFKDMCESDSGCAKCEYLTKCQGGCRAVGYATTGSFFGQDYMRCILYKKGFDKRFKAVCSHE